MADSDRRRQLELWRSRRGGGKAGEAPAGGAAAGAASSAAGKRRGGDAEAGPTPTKLVFGSENEARTGNVAAGAAPQSGAGRGGVKRAAEDAPAGVRAVSPAAAAADKERVSVAGIRERLAQSAKKRKLHLDERLAASAAKQSAERAAVDAVPAQELASLASDRTALRRHSLEQMVRAQVDVAEQLCASGNVRSAREALRELHADVGEATEVGEFWACLAGLELRAGNTLRAAGALVHALRSAGGAHAQVRALAAELLQKQLLQGVVTLHSLGELLAEPFAAAGEREAGARGGAASRAAGAAAAQAASPDVFEEEDDLVKYLKFNPNTTAKKRPQSALKSGVGRAVRVPVTFVEGDDEPSAPQPQPQPQASSLAQSCAPAPAAASKAVAAAAAAAAKDAALGLGSVTTVAAVKTTGKARETLGSSVSLTPVRRSGRLSKTPGKGEDRLALLKETGHTYVPNNQLLEED
jgi:hypothetical protein